MVDVGKRIKDGLDEARMLVLGAQVLLGFQYRSVFEPGFERLPGATQSLKVGALGLMLIAVGLLLAPASYHRIVARGESTPDVLRFITGVLAAALLPFSMGFGIDLFAATEKLAGRGSGVSLSSARAIASGRSSPCPIGPPADSAGRVR
jgi:hypothetical protein